MGFALTILGQVMLNILRLIIFGNLSAVCRLSFCTSLSGPLFDPADAYFAGGAKMMALPSNVLYALVLIDAIDLHVHFPQEL